MKKKNKWLFLTLGTGSLISSTMITNSCSVKTPTNNNAFTKFYNLAIQDSKNLDNVLIIINNNKNDLPHFIKDHNILEDEVFFYKKAISNNKNKISFSVIVTDGGKNRQNAYRVNLSIAYDDSSNKYNIKNWKIENTSVEKLSSWDLFKTEAINERNKMSLIMQSGIIKQLSNLEMIRTINLWQPIFHVNNVFNDKDHSLISKIGFLNNKKTISLQIKQTNHQSYNIDSWKPYQNFNFSDWNLNNSLYKFLNNANQENVFNILKHAKNDKTSLISKVNFDKNSVIKIKDIYKNFASNDFIYSVVVFKKDDKQQPKFVFRCNLSLQFNIYNIVKYNIKQWKINDFKLFTTSRENAQKIDFEKWSNKFKAMKFIDKKEFLIDWVNYQLNPLFHLSDKDNVSLKLIENNSWEFNLKYQMIDHTTKETFIMNVSERVGLLAAKINEFYLNNESGV